MSDIALYSLGPFFMAVMKTDDQPFAVILWRHNIHYRTPNVQQQSKLCTLENVGYERNIKQIRSALVYI